MHVKVNAPCCLALLPEACPELFFSSSKGLALVKLLPKDSWVFSISFCLSLHVKLG